MKKRIVLIIVLLFAILLCACSETTGVDISRSDLALIYEVGSSQNSLEGSFNHKNIVPWMKQEPFDSSVPRERVIKIGDVEYSMVYKETSSYPVRNKRVHRYLVNGDEEKIVFIGEDGNVDSIFYEYVYLDVSPKASPNEVLELLKIELGKMVDLSYYADVRIPEQIQSQSGYWSYKYLFYNSSNGYITDNLSVSVFSDGSVLGLVINNLGVEVPDIDINKEKEHQMIESKMKDIYNTDSTEYISYTRQSDPYIVVYENQLYVRYDVGASFRDKKYGGERASFLNVILVPLDLITN